MGQDISYHKSFINSKYQPKNIDSTNFEYSGFDELELKRLNNNDRIRTKSLRRNEVKNNSFDYSRKMLRQDSIKSTMNDPSWPPYVNSFNSIQEPIENIHSKWMSKDMHNNEAFKDEKYVSKKANEDDMFNLEVIDRMNSERLKKLNLDSKIQMSDQEKLNNFMKAINLF